MVKLEQLLNTVKTSPVSIGFLKTRVPDKVDVINYVRLKGRHRSEVFKGKRAVIVLIPKKGTKSGHFICLIPRKSHIEYFSSLGGSPTEELQKLHESLDIFENLLGKLLFRFHPQREATMQKRTKTFWNSTTMFLGTLKQFLGN